MNKTITLILVSAFALSIGFNILFTVYFEFRKTTFPGYQSVLSKEVFDKVNEYKTKNNLQPLVQNVVLCDMSLGRSVEVLKDWSHDGFVSRIQDANANILMRDSITYGENLSENYKSSEEIINAWINSPNHKKVLDDPYVYGCVSCYNNYCVLNTALLR